MNSWNQREGETKKKKRPKDKTSIVPFFLLFINLFKIVEAERWSTECPGFVLYQTNHFKPWGIDRKGTIFHRGIEDDNLLDFQRFQGKDMHNQ